MSSANDTYCVRNYSMSKKFWMLSMLLKVLLKSLSFISIILSQENERMKARSIIQYLNKKQNYSFIYWNWPLIRKTCLCSMFSFMIVVLCTVVVMIMTQPKNCDPNDTWRRTAMVYEIFPASFQDSNNDGEFFCNAGSTDSTSA